MTASNTYFIYRVEVSNAGHSPDGDTIWIKPSALSDENKAAKKLLARCQQANDNTLVGRLQDVDTAETHYYWKSQPDVWAKGATQKTLGLLKQSEILSSGNPEVWLVTKGVDGHGRLLSYFITDEEAARLPNLVLADGAGSVKLASGTESEVLINGAQFMMTPEIMTHTVNAGLLESGWAYPMPYTNEAPELRGAMQQIAQTARENNVGLWGAGGDQIFTEAGATVYSLQDIYSTTLIYPKIFRRMYESTFSTTLITACQSLPPDDRTFLETCFAPFMQTKTEKVCIVDENNLAGGCIDKVQLKDVFTIDTTTHTVKAKYKPEQLVFY